MSKTLVFIESKNGKIKRSSQELLTAAQKSGGEVNALALGADAAALLAEVGKYGAKNLHIVKDSSFNAYNPELFSNAVCTIISKLGAEIVLAAATSLGKDLFPRVAAKLQGGIISDATGIDLTAGNISAIKPVYSGKATAKMGFESVNLKIILMRPNQLPIIETPVTSQLVEHTVAAPKLGTLIKEIVSGASEKLDLTEANVIVAGGRGLKEAGNFKLLDNLAAVLGATVGASRAVVDAGWVSHGMQVGQTGKTVAPSLYIAVGISGAIQHLAGMSGSKVVVAINSDPNAPIFQKSTYGIVGDALEILPLLTEEFKKILS
jgi:electron transfer flavoprotein alpha subunit